MLAVATGTNHQVDLPLHRGHYPMDSLFFATGTDRIGLIAN
jgi:hypothetical protein